MGLITTFKQMLSAPAFGEIPPVCICCGVAQAQGRPSMIAGPTCWLCEGCARERGDMPGTAPVANTQCSFCGKSAGTLAEIHPVGDATICRPCLQLTIELFDKKKGP